VRIADLVLRRLARASGNLQECAMIPLQEDEKRRTPFQLRCPLFIAVSERRRQDSCAGASADAKSPPAAGSLACA